MQNALNSKANSSDIPTKTSDLTNDSGFITSTANNLINYYLKSETYTKSEVDNLLSAVSSLDIEVVQTLPTQDISTSTIYLVPKTSSTNDNYDEYIYVSNSWEHIGSTEVDLSNYATKTEVMTLLNHFAEYIFEQVGNAETVVVIPYPVGIGYGADEGYGTGPITRYQYTDTSVIELLDDIYAMYNQAASNSSNQINKDVYIKLMYTEGSLSFCTGFAKLTNVVFNPTDIRNHGNWDILLEFVSTEWDNNSSYDEFRYKIYGDIDDSIWSTSYLKSKTFTENLYEEIDGDISDLETSVSSKQDNLVSGTNIKTINNESILGSGNINISAGGGTMVDMRVNGSSVVDSNNVGNIATEGTYNASTNKIATMADMPLLGNAKTYYGTCSTASEAAEKEVNCSGFILETGAIITVIFTYGNKYNGTATLNVNNTGAKSIMRNLGSTATRYYWNNNEAIDFVYNGSSYVMIRTGPASSTYYGLTKLNNSVDSSSGIEAATPYAVKQAYDLANSKQSKITSSNKLDYSLIDNTPTIPTKVSDLTNDSGFITSYTETDPIFVASAASGITSSDITSWNNKSNFSGSYNDLTNKPTLFSGDYDDLTNKPTIPDELADLSDDSTHRLVTDTEKSTWNSKQTALVSGTNIKTVNNQSLLGSGNISITGGASNIENGTGTGSLKQAGNNTASGNYSFASGQQTTASSYGSHAEGAYANASGFYSHAEGYHTTASGQGAHAEGFYTTAKGQAQHVSGQYNVIDNSNKYIEIVGNGTSSANSNAYTLDWSGNGVYSGKLTVGANPTANMDVATKQYVDNNSGGEKIPIGTIFEFPTDDPTKLPTGYLFCDGSAVSRTTYADLFAVIGTIWGSGDGSTTFNLPSKEGLVTVGVDSNDTSFDTIGETGGEKTHTLTTDEIPSHTHRAGFRFAAPLGTSTTYDAWMYANNMAAGTVSTDSTGGGQAHNNLQPYVVSNYIIKAANVSQLPDEAEVVDGYSTSTTDAYSANYINNMILNAVYPVGSIYMSVNSTSPATLFGGKWVAISQGRTLVGVGTGTDINGDSMTWAAEATGGEYLHTLTIDEMPSHKHVSWIHGNVNPTSHSESKDYFSYSGWGSSYHDTWENTDNTGGGQAHNNIQPFFAVYMWKRTA